jgi:hypothetical protein
LVDEKGQNMKKSLDVKEILPRVVWCNPEMPEADRERKELASVDAAHTFETTQVYLLTEQEGQKPFGVVFCPIHHRPAFVEVKPQPPSTPQSGECV